jgi:hypothetical protein
LLVANVNNLVSFTTYAEWTALIEFSIQNGHSLENIETHAEWINLEYLQMDDCYLITSFVAHAEWVKLNYLIINGCSSLEVFTTHAEWINLTRFNVTECVLLTSLVGHPEWTKLNYLRIGGNPLLTSFITYATWIIEELATDSSTGLETLNIHREWTLLQEFYGNGCAFNVTTINNILIEANASGITTAILLLNDGTSATPTGDGITAYDALVLKGNTVVVNGYPV